MTEENIQKILNAMQGITYPDWVKLRNCIDEQFKTEASKIKISIKIAGADKIVAEYKRNYTLLGEKKKTTSSMKQSISEEELKILKTLSENQFQELVHQSHKSDTVSTPE